MLKVHIIVSLWPDLLMFGVVGRGGDVHQKPSPCLGVGKESEEEDLDL